MKPENLKIKLVAHCNDTFLMSMYKNGELVNNHEGNIPDTLPNNFGDDLTLTLTLNEETNKIEVANMTREMFLSNFNTSSASDEYTRDNYDHDDPDYDDDNLQDQNLEDDSFDEEYERKEFNERY